MEAVGEKSGTSTDDGIAFDNDGICGRIFWG